MPRNDGTASGEPTGRKPGGWDEANVGAVGNDAPVGVQGRSALHIDLICRTAVYVTRSYGGVGGGAVRLLPIPNGTNDPAIVPDKRHQVDRVRPRMTGMEKTD